jgi:hypothetical protein
VTEATIRFEVNSGYGSSPITDWYYNDDPSDHSEFDMQPILFRNIPGGLSAIEFNGPASW